MTTSNGQLEQLSASGRKVVDSRAQIAAILGNRIGKPAARLFAEPSGLKADGSVDWVDVGGEPLVALEKLPPDRKQNLIDRFVELKEQIEALASRMETEGDAGQLAARVIRHALVTPDGFDALHAAGEQPVLVNWGHAAPGQILPGTEPPDAAANLDPPPPVSASPSAGVAAADGADPGSQPEQPAGHAARPFFEDGEQDHRKAAAYPSEHQQQSRLGLVAWVIPLLLLLGLGYVVWLLFQPLEPIVVEEELPPAEFVDPVPEAVARRDALLARLDEATRLREGLTGICVALPEPEPPRPEPVIVEPPVTPVEPPEVVEREPEPQPPLPLPETERIELPPEAPKAEDIPVDIARVPTPARPEPTLCEPGWTPTQRPEVMVVIDGSGSMSESFPGASSRIDAARKATEEVVRNLHKDIRTGLVSFTDCDATSTPRKYRYSERPELIGRVRGVSPTRGTSLANSIRRAGNAAKSGGPATVVVVSDGEDTCGGDPCAAARKLKAQKPLLKINVIDLSGGRSSVLQCVASVTGGRVFTPRSASQMNEEMQQATGQPDASQCNG